MKSTLSLAIGMACFFSSASSQEPRKEPAIVVREIDLAGHLPAKAFMREPDELHKGTNITSAEKLAEVFPHKLSQKLIAPHVDFSKETLVLFAWEDAQRKYTLSPSIDKSKKPPVIVFRWTGESFANESISYNAHVFVLPKGAAWRFFGR